MLYKLSIKYSGDYEAYVFVVRKSGNLVGCVSSRVLYTMHISHFLLQSLQHSLFATLATHTRKDTTPRIYPLEELGEFICHVLISSNRLDDI